jgi:hypothetical protein
VVDIADLGYISSLYDEAGAIDAAFVNFTRGGYISTMTISAWPREGDVPEEAPASSGNVQVTTNYISYPPQMIDAIQNALHERRTAINSELQSLGVTGLEDIQPRQPAAAAGGRPRPRPGG